jgi:hypothetical protein
VPLEVLANDNDAVNADLFLLTDQQLHPAQPVPAFTLPPFSFGTTNSVDGAQGLSIAGSQRLDAPLYSDLSGDRNMSWIPSDGWLTYLQLRAPSESVTYDLGVGGDNLIRLASFGTSPARTVSDRPVPAAGGWALAVASAAGISACIVGALICIRRLRLRAARRSLDR